MILVPVSLGELYDKISILEIKMERIKDKEKIFNINNELNVLKEIAKSYPINKDLFKKLIQLNEELWNIEDQIRIKEKNKEFDEEFITLARLVYFTNDKRSDIKREINKIHGSEIIEEKSYERY